MAFKDAPENMVFCVGFDGNTTRPDGGAHTYKESRLYSSTDWFENKKYVDLGIGKKARGVVGLGVVSKFMVAALRVADGEMGRSVNGGGDPM